jgi:hypothetical protein
MTGPTSPEGKARSSQNARKHGLTAGALHLSPEEAERFEQLKAALHAELQPLGEFENSCLDRAVNSYWRLKLAQISENQALAAFLRAPESEPLQAAYERFFKYRRHYERSYERALRDLRLAQENRFLQANMNLPSHTDVTPSLPLRQILRDFRKFQNELPKALCSLKVFDTETGQYTFHAAREAAEKRRISENRRLSQVALAPADLLEDLKPLQSLNPMSRSGFAPPLKIPKLSRSAA